MPQGDKTGPNGKGPGTGRGTGQCQDTAGAGPDKNTKGPGLFSTIRKGLSTNNTQARGRGKGQGRRRR